MMANQHKITIQGTAPKYDPNQLTQLVAEAKHKYSNSPKNCIVVRSDIDREFLQMVADKLNQGYALSPYPLNLWPINFNCHLIKSQTHQDSDLAQLEVDVKAEYVEFLEAEHVRYKDLLLAQLLQAEELKAAKRAEQAQAKLLAELQAQVAATFTPLQIPE